VTHIGEERKLYRGLAGKQEGKRSRSRWKDGIRMDLRDIGWRAQNGFIWLRIGAGGGLL
jgi:hypothetical protein